MRIISTISFLALAVLGISCVAGGGATTPGGQTGPGGNKKIFMTANAYTGVLGGAVGADAKCMSDSRYPGSGSYKALIADGARRACSSANCLGGGNQHAGWVLFANQEYRRLDDSTIGITNASAIFDFPLSESFGTAAAYVWTGINADWTTSTDTCTNWSNTAANGVMGYSSSTTSPALQFGLLNCSTGAYLICVQQ